MNTELFIPRFDIENSFVQLVKKYQKIWKRKNCQKNPETIEWFPKFSKTNDS